jgi:hypothetical protein
MCARCDEFLAAQDKRQRAWAERLRTEAAAQVKDFSPDIARLERGLEPVSDPYKLARLHAHQSAVRTGAWHGDIWAAHDAAVAVEAARMMEVSDAAE